MTISRTRRAHALALAVLTSAACLGDCSGEPGGPGSGVTSVTVTPKSATLAVQGTVRLSATVRDAKGTVLSGRPITWTTDRAPVATVDANGMVTGVGAGAAGVIATSEGVSDTAAITVVATIAFGSVSAGGGHNCGLTTSGWYCWGYNGEGELGDGSTTSRSVPVAVTGGLTFYAVTAGAYLSCGLTTTGAPYCWGARWGSRDSIPVAVPGGHVFSAVTVGGGFGPDHACGLTTSGAVYCWGNNGYGQVGDGTTGGSEYYNGWSIRSVPVAVVGGLSFAALTAGTFHTCGLTGNGAAYCWGDNEYGQLGDGSTTSYSSVPVAVSGGLTFSALSATYHHTCGVTASGAAYCWGYNGAGQFGDGSSTSSSVPVAVSGGLTFSVVTAGALHTCGLTTGGGAYCWGWSALGRLGTGADTGPDQCLPQYNGGCSRKPLAVAGGLTFARLSAGGNHSCGVTVGGIAYCWGENNVGQLGTGDVTGPEQCVWGAPATLSCSTRPAAVARPAVVP